MDVRSSETSERAAPRRGSTPPTTLLPPPNGTTATASVEAAGADTDEIRVALSRSVADAVLHAAARRGISAGRLDHGLRDGFGLGKLEALELGGRRGIARAKLTADHLALCVRELGTIVA